MIEKMVDDYLNYVDIYLSNGTYRFYKEKLYRFLRYCKTYNIKDLEVFRSHIGNYIKTLGKIKNSTKNKYLKAVEQLYKFNDLDFKIKALKNDKIRYEALTFGEVKEIIHYSKTLSLDNQLIITLFIDTGMRLNELLNIEIKNIDLEKSRILLTTTKTNKPRYVFYSKLTSSNLELKLAFCKTEKLFSFTGSKVNSLMQKIKKDLGILASAHRFRHFFATNLLKNGVDIYAVKELLGHTDIKTTEIYLHYDPYDLKNIYNVYKQKFIS